MDTLTQHSSFDVGRSGQPEQFLPPETPLPMHTQQLRYFSRNKQQANAETGSVALRRGFILAGTGAMTIAGCYEMYRVLEVGGVTVLEWLVLVLFVLLFAWVAFSFMSALAGFAVLLFRSRDPLGIDPDAPLPSIGSRIAMLLPTYNEDPYRIMARLRAMYEAIDQAGYGSRFDWFVLSDTTNPSIWIAEEQCFLRLRREKGANNIFYRHRPQNTARKSGNIEDWIKRFGGGYDHMIVLH